jgi:hypothetical protein
MPKLYANGALALHIGPGKKPFTPDKAGWIEVPDELVDAALSHGCTRTPPQVGSAVASPPAGTPPEVAAALVELGQQHAGLHDRVAAMAAALDTADFGRQISELRERVAALEAAPSSAELGQQISALTERLAALKPAQ